MGLSGSVLDAIQHLKTVAVQEHNPSAGLKAPIGVVSFDPKYSGSYSNSRAQTLTIPLIPATVEMINKAPPPKAGDYPIAAALNQFRQEILDVDHDKLPCFQADDKTPFKMTLAFDVVNKTSAEFGLQLVVFKVSDKEVFTNEAHQTLEIEFAPRGTIWFTSPGSPVMK